MDQPSYDNYNKKYLVSTVKIDGDSIIPPGINGTAVASKVFCQWNNINDEVELLGSKSNHFETCALRRCCKDDKYDIKTACSGKIVKGEIRCREIYQIWDLFSDKPDLGNIFQASLWKIAYYVYVSFKSLNI